VVHVDYSTTKGPLNTFFREIVGAGRAAEGLRADWQRDLAIAHRECGFKYIRFHGLLEDELGVYREDREGKPIYNFQYIDAIYDSILKIGMKPFVELGFMPQALASGNKTIFWWKGNVTPTEGLQQMGSVDSKFGSTLDRTLRAGRSSSVVFRSLERTESRWLLVWHAG
jgi:xylan 1,4-beta-xylosidase